MQTQLTEELIAIIKDMAAGMGFADWGVANLCEAVDERTRQRYLSRMHEQGFAQMGYLERNLGLRFNPQELVPDARSIIVFLVPFGSNERIDHPAPISVSSNERIDNPATISAALNDSPEYINAAMQTESVESTTCKTRDNTDTSKSAVPDNMFCASQFALGQDYHKVIKNKIWNIMAEIKRLEPGFEGRAFVDSAPVLERYWAVRAGLGFIGKNNFLISPKAGIRNFIGCIICNLNIPCSNLQSSYNGPDAKAISADPRNCQFTNSSGALQTLISANTCGSCRKCIDACPSGALSAPFTIEVEKCISYRTIEAPDAPDTRRKIISGELKDPGLAQTQRPTSIFGCDRCMDACPWNRFNLPGWSEFEPQALPVPISHFHRR